jgi:tripartite-type tricarboxylate transporter receptor subunit TctC
MTEERSSNPLPTWASQRRRAHWQRLRSANALRRWLRYAPQGEGYIMRSIGLAVVWAFIVSWIAPVGAQTSYPDKSIRLVYGFPAGADLVARIYADKLAEAFGKPVVVDNVTGAAGNIGADRLAKAPPDGYTIGILGSANVTTNTILYRKLPYDPVKDLVPVTQIFGYPNLLLVNNDVPARTVQELVALARAQPNKLTYGHAGVGTTTHLSAELFKSMAHINIQDVPYRGPPQIATDMMSGQISMTFIAPGPLLPLVREQKIRALAVTSRARAPFAPDLPTMDESGFRGFDITVWYGLFVPAGTPALIVEKLNRESVKIMNSPDVRKRTVDLGNVPVTSTAAQLAEIIQAETALWARIVNEAGIKPIE